MATKNQIETDVATLVKVLVQQVNDLNQQAVYLFNIAQNISQLLDPVGTLDLNVQIKSYIATANIQLTAINSQDVLVQQTIDNISAKL